MSKKLNSWILMLIFFMSFPVGAQEGLPSDLLEMVTKNKFQETLDTLWRKKVLPKVNWEKILSEVMNPKKKKVKINQRFELIDFLIMQKDVLAQIKNIEMRKNILDFSFEFSRKDFAEKLITLPHYIQDMSTEMINDLAHKALAHNSISILRKLEEDLLLDPQGFGGHDHKSLIGRSLELRKTEISNLLLNSLRFNPNGRLYEHHDQLLLFTGINLFDDDMLLQVLSHPDFRMDIVDESGNNILIRLLQVNKEDLFLHLLERQDFNLYFSNEEFGDNYFESAARQSHVNVFTALIHHPQFRPNRLVGNRTPLMILLQSSFQHSPQRNELINTLLDNPELDPNIPQGDNGNTLLFEAIKLGDRPLVMRLLARGADLNAHLNDGQGIVEYAYAHGHYRTLRDLIDPNLRKLEMEKAFQELNKIAKIPTGLFNCTAEAMWSHQVWAEDTLKQGDNPSETVLGKRKRDTQEFKDQTSCKVCLSEFVPEQTYLQLQGCGCGYCPRCARNLKSDYMKNQMGKIPTCYHHPQEIIPFSFFKMAGASEQELDNYRQQIISSELERLPDFKYCLTPGCPNGRVVPKGQELWLTCQMCGRESHLTNDFVPQDLIFKKIPHPRDIHRPCPYCRTIYSKDDHCNHVKCLNKTCPSAGKTWNFLSGKEDPKGIFDLHDRGPRTYRVEGDLNYKTGEYYKEYVEGVKPEDDLLPEGENEGEKVTLPNEAL